MENLPASSDIEPKMELAPEISKQSVHHIHKPDAPRDNTMGMILLRRRFSYASRPRPNALAIVDPATNQVLYPGIAKIEKSADAEKEVAVGDGDAKVNIVFQSYEQQPQQQIYYDFPAQINQPMHIIVPPEMQYPTSFGIQMQYPTIPSFDRNNSQTSFQQPIKYHDLPYMNDGRNQ